MQHPPYFYALILFVSALAGGLTYAFTKKKSGKGIKLLLTYSAAYLLGLTLLHLFPELFHSGIAHPGWYVLGGFLLQIVLDYFSHGVEHGHAHHHHEHGTKFMFTVMASLWVHAFIEGMPFGGVFEHVHVHDHVHDHAHHHGHDHRDSLLIGISLHKVTEAFVFMALLISTNMKLRQSIFWLVIFCLMAPAGAFVHYIIGEQGIANLAELTPKVTGVLIGILLHVSTMILFESEEGHKFNRLKFGMILLGLACAALVS
jgi:zinc and cadmium transporter